MFPTQLEIETLHAERLREAEMHRRFQEVRGPSLFERIRTRLSMTRETEPTRQEPVAISQRARRDAIATSR